MAAIARSTFQPVVATSHASKPAVVVLIVDAKRVPKIAAHYALTFVIAAAKALAMPATDATTAVHVAVRVRVDALDKAVWSAAASSASVVQRPGRTRARCIF